MYFSNRSLQVRNVSLAIVNGSITLIILLIAPLGIVAVMINTALVAAATYVTAIVADRVVLYLQGDQMQRAELLDRPGRSEIQRVDADDLERR
jgi:hypothetical protein